MKLYGSPTSPYVRKARVLIREKNLDCTFVMEDPWPENSPIPARNPLGKVPVLEIAPDRYLFESAVVVHYLDHVDGMSLTPTDTEDYWQAQWWQALGNGIIDAAVARVLESRRPVERQMPEKMEREENRIRRATAAAETAFAGGDFLLGGRFSIADVVLGVALQYVDFRYRDDWRLACPKLSHWHAGITSRSAFEDTLPPGFIKPAAF